MSINIINISNISGAYIGNNISHQLILNTPINFKNSSINIVPIMVIMTFLKNAESSLWHFIIRYIKSSDCGVSRLFNRNFELTSLILKLNQLLYYSYFLEATFQNVVFHF